MGFHNFRLNTPPSIRNVFHVDRLRAVSTDFFPSQISDDNHPAPTIIGNENGTHEYDVEKILKKKQKGRSYQYLVKWKIYVRFTWEPVSIMENTCDGLNPYGSLVVSPMGASSMLAKAN